MQGGPACPKRVGIAKSVTVIVEILCRPFQNLQPLRLAYRQRQHRRQVDVIAPYDADMVVNIVARQVAETFADPGMRLKYRSPGLQPKRLPRFSDGMKTFIGLDQLESLHRDLLNGQTETFAGRSHGYGYDSGICALVCDALTGWSGPSTSAWLSGGQN